VLAELTKMLDFDLMRRSPPRPLTDKLAPRLTFDDAPVASRLVEPADVMFPFRVTEDPVTDVAPAEVRLPVLECAPAAVIAKLPPEEMAPETVVPAEVLEISTIPREVIGAAFVTVDAPAIRTVPALIPLELTFTREVVLETVKS
jgi:hypothetical protein